MPGNSLGGRSPGRPPNPPPKTEDEILAELDEIRADPVKKALEVLASALADGDTTVAVKMLDLHKRYGIKSNAEQRPEHLNAERHRHLPIEAAELSYRMECGVGETVRRYERGYCCELHEVLLAKAAISVRDNNGRSNEAAKLRKLCGRAIKLLADAGIKGWLAESKN